MKRQTGKIGIVICAVLGSTLLLGAVPASAGTKPPKVNFDKLKPIKAPSPCKNDTGVTDTEIKVGALVPLSGPGARIAPALDGFNARVAKANALGELGNRKITVINQDDKNDNTLNSSGAQALVEQEKVFAVFEASGGAGASAQYLYDNGIPVVGWSIGLPAWGTYPNMFNTPSTGAPSTTTFSSVYADIFKKLGAKKVAIVTTNTSATVVNVNQVSAAIDAVKGIDVAYKTSDVPLGTSDWGAYAQNVKNSGADALYFAGNPTDAAALASAIKQSNYPLKAQVFAGAYDPRVVGIPGLDQAYTTTEPVPFETNPPELPDFQKYLTQVSPGSAPNGLSTPGWIAGDLFVQGIKSAGVSCPTQKAFINNLRLEKSFDAGGWFKPVNMSEQFGTPVSCYYVSQLVNKAWTPAFNGQQVCASQQLKDNQVVPPTTVPAATTTTVAR